MTPDLFAIVESRERFTTIHAPALVILADGEGPDPEILLSSGPKP
jgi:hypothetical protein